MNLQLDEMKLKKVNNILAFLEGNGDWVFWEITRVKLKNIAYYLLEIENEQNEKKPSQKNHILKEILIYFYLCRIVSAKQKKIDWKREREREISREGEREGRKISIRGNIFKR